MDNFLNMYSLNHINWIWVFEKIMLFLYFYILIYYIKLLFVQQLLSVKNSFKASSNKLMSQTYHLYSHTDITQSNDRSKLIVLEIAQAEEKTADFHL
jgi:hypothetical protein